MRGTIMTTDGPEKIGLWATVSIGVGGMVGGGIFAVLGLAVQIAHGATPVAFLAGGLVALATCHAYTRLSAAYPSQGGTVEFLNQAFGSGIVTGGLNILLWISYVVMLSLYARAFGSYGASFLPVWLHPTARHLILSAGLIVLTALNALGARAVGEAEEWIVGVKIAILTLFCALGVWSVKVARLEASTWPSPVNVLAGAMIIFLAYEGFELIANAAHNVRDPAKTLPRAYYISVVSVIVLYVLVALVTVGNLDVPRIVAAKDYALAEAARPFLGQTGFILIAIAAMLSTGSAINATLYGATRFSYIIAKDGELPEVLEHKTWSRPLEGLFLTSGAALLAANLLDLSSIATAGSSGFLLIFAAVNLASARLHRKIGSNRWLSLLGAAACLVALAALIWQRAQAHAVELWALAGLVAVSFVIEAVYRLATGRVLKPHHKAPVPRPA
jgi:amino acid transporter